MKDSIKFTAVSSGAALILAIIINLFSGSDFGTVFVRSLVTALVWGGASFGILFLIKTFLPELLSSEAENEDDTENQFDASEETSEGQNVNIVLPEDNPYQGDNEAVKLNTNTENVESTDIIEEVREQVHPDSYASDTFSQEDVVETIGNDVDSLPDMSWSGDFGGTINENGNSSNASSGSNTASSQSSSGGTGPNGEDPAFIAKAISTVLKRSEQG